MKSGTDLNFSYIENRNLNLSKKLQLFYIEGKLYAIIYPNLDEAKKRKLVRLENEIRWYGVELFNIESKNNPRIDAYQIVRHPLPKDANGALKRGELETFLKTKSYISSIKAAALQSTCSQDTYCSVTRGSSS